MVIIPPWQEEPIRQIAEAILQVVSSSDQELNQAYVWMDNGVEKALKNYLVYQTTSDDPGSSERPASGSHANFPTLLKSVKNAAEDRFGDDLLQRIRYYHEIRNDVYHDGKVIVTRASAESYAECARELLRRLFGIDVSANEDDQPDIGTEPADAELDQLTSQVWYGCWGIASKSRIALHYIHPSIVPAKLSNVMFESFQREEVTLENWDETIDEICTPWLLKHVDEDLANTIINDAREAFYRRLDIEMAVILPILQYELADDDIIKDFPDLRTDWFSSWVFAMQFPEYLTLPDSSWTEEGEDDKPVLSNRDRTVLAGQRLVADIQEIIIWLDSMIEGNKPEDEDS